MANKTLTEALAEISTLNASLASANETISGHAGLVTALTNESDNLKSALASSVNDAAALTTRAETAEGSLATAAASLTTAQSEVTRLTNENTALASKEQDIQTRAAAIASKGMGGIGQPPVAGAKVPDPGSKPVIPPIGSRGRVEAAMTAGLAAAGITGRR